MNIYCVNKHSVLLLFKSVQIPISLMYWIFLNLRLFYTSFMSEFYTLFIFHMFFTYPCPPWHFEDPWTYITNNVIGWIKKYLPIKSPERSSLPIPSADHIIIFAIIYSNIHDITNLCQSIIIQIFLKKIQKTIQYDRHYNTNHFCTHLWKMRALKYYI